MNLKEPLFRLKNAKYKGENVGYFFIGNFKPVTDISEHPKFPSAPKYNMRFKATKIVGLDPGLTEQDRLSDPYLQIYAISYGQNEFLLIHQTDYIPNTKECEWEPFCLTTESCGGLDSPIRVNCWDKNKSRKDEHIGETIITLRQMKMMVDKSHSLPLYDTTSKNEANRTVKRAILSLLTFEPVYE